LRSLENDGLVVVEQSGTDGRVRTARLTARGLAARGLAERAVLDRRSDEAAESIPRPLSVRQRTRLITAMAEAERLLVSSAVQVTGCHPRRPAARFCLRAYISESARRFDGGFDPTVSISAGEELTPPAGLLLVATLHGESVGCGALELHDGAPAEIKRMWVAPAVRGPGVGRRLLTALEAHAATRGVRTLRLETNRALDEAISLYRASGYQEWRRSTANPTPAIGTKRPSPGPPRRAERCRERRPRPGPALSHPAPDGTTSTGRHHQPRTPRPAPALTPYQGATDIFPLPNVVRNRHSGHDDSI
jgi:GNAT superfamily N-acetyltransferase